MGGDGGTGGTTGQEFPCTEQGIRDAIAKGGGPHTFDCDGTASVVTQSEIKIDNDVILDGEGRLTVDGGGRHRVFEVVGRRVELRGITVSGGQGPTGRSSYGAGGILQNGGVLTLMDCTVSGNVNPGVNPFGVNQPGNILTRDGELVLANSTVSNNTGGGIGTTSGILTVTNSTVSGNLGYPVDLEPRWASGVYATRATIINSTISGDIAIYGRYVGSFPSIDIVVTATLIDGECQVENEARLTTNGYNIESPGNTCAFDHATDQPEKTPVDLNLGPLQNNGGPTETHEPGGGEFGTHSVAIDQIPAADCVDSDGAPLTTDQRGEPRPAGAESKCDIGSFEVQEEGE
jgi:hypothetical protein